MNKKEDPKPVTIVKKRKDATGINSREINKQELRNLAAHGSLTGVPMLWFPIYRVKKHDPL